MVASAGAFRALTTDFQRSEPCPVSSGLGGNLIDRDSGLKIGPIGLARMAAGQKGCHGASMVATAIAVGARWVERETTQD
jgi:hypothetical protein